MRCSNCHHEELNYGAKSCTYCNEPLRSPWGPRELIYIANVVDLDGIVGVVTVTNDARGRAKVSIEGPVKYVKDLVCTGSLNTLQVSGDTTRKSKPRLHIKVVLPAVATLIIGTGFKGTVHLDFDGTILRLANFSRCKVTSKNGWGNVRIQ